MSPQQWDRTKRIALEARVEETKFDSLVLLYCIDMKNSELGCNYLEHIEKENNGRLSNDVLSLCLKMLTKLNHSEAEILRMADRMMNSGEPLEEDHLPSLIGALSTTSEWEKGLELMKNYKSLTEKPVVSQRVLQKLCVAALRNNRLAEVKAVAMEAKFNETQFDSSVMNACLEEKNVAWARAYFDLVERQHKRECSIFMLTQYLSILELSEECVDEDILAIVVRLGAMHPMPADVLTAIISALCTTAAWQKAVPMLQYYRGKDGKLHVPIHLCKKLCIAHIRHGHPEESWQYLDMFFENSGAVGKVRPAIDDVIQAYLQYANTLKTEEAKEEAMIILFNKLGELQAFPDIETKDRISKYAQDLGWQVRDVSFPNKRSVCSVCNTELGVTVLSDRDFQDLQETFFNKVIKESNIFLNTSPDEWGSFIRVCKNNAPFTHVMDGLNVGLSNRHRKGKQAQRLHSVLMQIHDRCRHANVLIIGSKHMLNWAGINQVKRRAVIYLLDNETKDDLFFIYAAMMSGQQAKIVTKDQMRNHAFKLASRKFQHDFRLWQQQAQVKVFDNNETGQKCQLDEPAPFTHACQGSEGVFHLPYDNGRLTYDWQLPNSWLCLVKEGRKKKENSFNTLRE